jgi:hypothetical protein
MKEVIKDHQITTYSFILSVNYSDYIGQYVSSGEGSIPYTDPCGVRCTAVFR